MSVPLDWDGDPTCYQRLEVTYQLVIVAFYRGAWCAVCCAWISCFQDAQPSLKSFLERNNACLVLVSAQDARQMQRLVHELPGLNFERVYILADEETAFANWWNERGFGQVFISAPTTRYGYRYPHGLLQPALFTLRNGELIYSWSSQPSIRNLGGAIERPDPSKVLMAIEQRLYENDHDRTGAIGRSAVAFREQTLVFFGRIIRRLMGKS